MGQLDFGIEAEMMSQVVHSIKAACTQGVQVAIVVGGGNIFRGVQGSASGMAAIILSISLSVKKIRRLMGDCMLCLVSLPGYSG